MSRMKLELNQELVDKHGEKSEMAYQIMRSMKKAKDENLTYEQWEAIYDIEIKPHYRQVFDDLKYGSR